MWVEPTLTTTSLRIVVSSYISYLNHTATQAFTHNESTKLAHIFDVCIPNKNMTKNIFCLEMKFCYLVC